MTMRYARAAFYSCDAPGCTSEVDGFDDRLPPGWRTATEYYPGAMEDGPRETRWRVHYCPACIPPEGAR